MSQTAPSASIERTNKNQDTFSEATSAWSVLNATFGNWSLIQLKC